MPHRAQQIILQEYVHAIQERLERVQRLTRQIQDLLSKWQLAPLVKALQSLRGVSLIVAATTVSELGDLTRFDSAKQLMAYLGLVPSEHSSGGTIRRGGITKTGNGHVRRALTEAAHTYCHPARESRVLLARLEGLPQEVRQISWKAQVWLCGRFKALMARGTKKLSSQPQHVNLPHSCGPSPVHCCQKLNRSNRFKDQYDSRRANPLTYKYPRPEAETRSRSGEPSKLLYE